MVRGGNGAPLCPGQLLSRSQGLKPEPLGGGGAETLTGVGGGSWVEPGFRGAGVLETQAPPGRTFLQRLAALGKVTHQLVMRLGRCRPRGSKGEPDSARCPGSTIACGGEAPPQEPQSRGSDIQSGSSSQGQDQGALCAPQLREVPPPTLELPGSLRRPPHSGSRTSGTRYLPPATAGPELRVSCALSLTPELRGTPCHPSIPGS